MVLNTVSPESTSAAVRDWKSVAAFIDHTLLKPDATPGQIELICAEAAQFNFASVCVNPGQVSLVADVLRGSRVKTCTVIGFPLGATTTTTKRFEALEALRNGAQELDMVLNIGALRTNDRSLVVQDILGVVQAAHSAGAIVKVIFETSLLSIEQKIVACELSVTAGADFVKTSTGFGGGGATVDDVHLMRGVVGQRAGVKASGGIRSASTALAMLEAGADRLGTSSGVAIVSELGAQTEARQTPVNFASY